LIKRVLRSLFPHLERQFTRTMTIPHNANLADQNATYLNFDAVVGRNSAFPLLTTDELEQLGGVEYRALNALLWIVGLVKSNPSCLSFTEFKIGIKYYVGIQILAFIMIAPYISTSEWKDVFLPPALHQRLKPAWYGFMTQLLPCVLHRIQVRFISSNFGLHEYWNVASGSIHGSLPDGLFDDICSVFHHFSG